MAVTPGTNLDREAVGGSPMPSIEPGLAVRAEASRKPYPEAPGLVLLALALLLGLRPRAVGVFAILKRAPRGPGDFGSDGLRGGTFVWEGAGLSTELVTHLLLLPGFGLAARPIAAGNGQTGPALALALTAL